MKILLFLLLLIGNVQAQQTTGLDVLPNTNSTDSTAIINDQFRKNLGITNSQQLSINILNGLFYNNILQTQYGGTGVDSSNWPSGDYVYMSGTGTWGHITPTFATTVLFSSSGTYTVPSNITVVYLTGCGGGGGGNGPAGTTSTAGGNTIFDALNIPGGGAASVAGGAGISPGNYNATGSSLGTFYQKSGNGGTGSTGQGGSGGASPFGVGATGTLSTIPSAPTANSCSGGGGNSNGSTAGNGGAAGAYIFHYPYSVTPGNTYTVTIGAAGAGSGTNTGGPGATGILMVSTV